MKKVTYISHSGFTVELDKICILFDYWKGDMPEFPADKALMIFSSHHHPDHYNPEIWNLAKRYENVYYVLGSDIVVSDEDREKYGIDEATWARTLTVKGNKHFELQVEKGDISETVVIDTMHSTDEGVAFYVTCEGTEIFYAGDLHLWKWPGEDEAINNFMQASFEKRTSFLRGKKPDMAFVLIDPRIEHFMYEGIDYYLSIMEPKAIFPMHIWDRYDLIQEYKISRKDNPLTGKIVDIVDVGQIVEL